MTDNLYNGKIVLVPFFVDGNHSRFNGEYSYTDVSCELVKGNMWGDCIMVDKRLVIEPTEEQLVEIERYV